MALLRRRGKTVGVLVADQAAHQPWVEPDRQFLLQLTARVSDELPRLREKQLTEAQLRIATQLLEDRRPNDIFYHVLDALHHLTRYDHSGALLIYEGRRVEGSERSAFADPSTLNPPSSTNVLLRAEKITWEKRKSQHV